MLLSANLVDYQNSIILYKPRSGEILVVKSKIYFQTAISVIR